MGIFLGYRNFDPLGLSIFSNLRCPEMTGDKSTVRGIPMKQVTIILLLLPNHSRSSRAVEVPDVYQLNPYMEVLPDPSGEWTLADVTGPWTRTSANSPEGSEFGYSRWPIGED